MRDAGAMRLVEGIRNLHEVESTLVDVETFVIEGLAVGLIRNTMLV